MSVEERIKRLIMDGLGSDYDTLTDEATFVDDLGADSLDLVELVEAAEAEFNIEIPDADAERIRTIRDAIEYVEAAAERTDAAPSPHPTGAETAAAPAAAETTPAAAGDDRPDTTV